MTNIQGTAIIRDRGQLTIPDKIREAFDWIRTNSVISIKALSDKELVIKPYEKEKEVDWDKIWKNLRKIRSYKSGNPRPASQIVAEDRYQH